MLSKAFHFFNYFFGGFLYLKRFQTLQEGLQIFQKGSRRGDDDFVFSSRALDKVIFSSANFARKQVVINSFMWDEHKSKVSRALHGLNIFCSFQNSIF